MQSILKQLRKWRIAIGVLALGMSSAAHAESIVDEAPNNALVTVSGTVGKVLDSDEFELAYIGGNIVVDTNDAWPELFRADPAGLKPGDRVTVTGRVDNNLFTKKEIDATSISHRGTGYTRFYEAEGYVANAGAPVAFDPDDISVSGRVSQVLSNEEFVLDYGTGALKVTANKVAVPSTEQLRVGDQITVYGEMDDNWFGKREIDADYIVRTSYYPPRG